MKSTEKKIIYNCLDKLIVSATPSFSYGDVEDFRDWANKMKNVINASVPTIKIIIQGIDTDSSPSLHPTDKEVEKWFEENIGEDCSSSSAIYKFRLWLKDREINRNK